MAHFTREQIAAYRKVVATLKKRRSIPEPPPTKSDEDSAKFYASILLCDISKKIVIPTKQETLGFHLLERDDELRRMN